MSWKDLPAEVKRLIFEQLPNRQHLAILCRVSKEFQHIALPFLYQTIEISLLDECYFKDPGLAPLLRTLSEHPKYLALIKNIRIYTQFHRQLQNRCLHRHERSFEYRRILEDSSSESGMEDEHEHEHEHEHANVQKDEDGEPTLSHLGFDILSLLCKLRDNSLRSFSWHVGTCVPTELLGPSGYLSTKQNQIESLSLITDSHCKVNNGTKRTNRTIPYLAGFTSLQNISWRGVQFKSDFQALQGVLEANSKHLRSLELDLVDWASAKHYYCYEETDEGMLQHFLAWSILRLGSVSGGISFPYLQALSLTGVSFHVAASEMASAFNFSGLRSLKLHRCPQIQTLLRGVIQWDLRIKLVSLELVMDCDDSLNISNLLASFLGSFRGLEALHLLLNDSQDCADL